MSPTISICLPTRNSMAFLHERLQSIERQTFQDWELIAVDGFSTDGTHEALLDFAAGHPRVLVLQSEPDGIYPNFNRCIHQATGEFIHIATSDDTMADECLEKLVTALRANPDCEIAHCPMRVIDSKGNPAPDWWSRRSLFARSSGRWIHIAHKRPAPLDGLLCLLGDNIYSSVTQLVIRRSLFARIGGYRNDWGSAGDFHWNLRAGLAASTIHVPDTWGGWRMHGNQASASLRLHSPEHEHRIDAMIAEVLADPDRYLDATQRHTFKRLEPRARELRIYLREHSRLATTRQRRMFLLRGALSGRRPAWRHLSSIVHGVKQWPVIASESVRSWFNDGALIPRS